MRGIPNQKSHGNIGKMFEYIVACQMVGISNGTHWITDLGSWLVQLTIAIPLDRPSHLKTNRTVWPMSLTIAMTWILAKIPGTASEAISIKCSGLIFDGGWGGPEQYFCLLVYFDKKLSGPLHSVVDRSQQGDPQPCQRLEKSDVLTLVIFLDIFQTQK